MRMFSILGYLFSESLKFAENLFLSSCLDIRVERNAMQMQFAHSIANEMILITLIPKSKMHVISTFKKYSRL